MIKCPTRLPGELPRQAPKSHLISEKEWRSLNVQQSLGWVHHMIQKLLPKLQQKYNPSRPSHEAKTSR
uniref:Cyclin-dependent kinases regulatory subunit n=1 Tax=Peromyscus maniculatus bairdii TaxID=230844 RepID=A0A8C8UGB6_PERMB